MRNEEKLVLASASPRRRELMALTGLQFIVDAPMVDEQCDLPAREAVEELCRRKAKAGAELHPGMVILAADTLVSVDNKALGKPRDEDEAFEMLSMLRARRHQVYTGVCVMDAQGNAFSGVDCNDVIFGDMTDEEIRAYIATGEPMDKAGAYAMQGMAGLWIERVEGSPSGVIGLPLNLTLHLLRKCGIKVPV